MAPFGARRQNAEPRALLACIDPNQAHRVDCAAGVHVRLCLQGRCWPPTVQWRLYVHHGKARRKKRYYNRYNDRYNDRYYERYHDLHVRHGKARRTRSYYDLHVFVFNLVIRSLAILRIAQKQSRVQQKATFRYRIRNRIDHVQVQSVESAMYKHNKLGSSRNEGRHPDQSQTRL